MTAVGDIPNGKESTVPLAGAAPGSGCSLTTQDTTLLSKMRGNGILHMQAGFLFPNSSGKSQEPVTKISTAVLRETLGTEKSAWRYNTSRSQHRGRPQKPPASHHLLLLEEMAKQRKLK